MWVKIHKRERSTDDWCQCDETQPHCKRCHRKRLECAWPDRSQKLSHKVPDGECNKIVGEMELAKHYLTHTVHTFAALSTDREQSAAWRIYIPAVALSCPVVRRGLLALAAICMYYDHADDHDRSKYMETAEAHGRIFVQKSSRKLQKIQKTSEHDSVLACSRLLCVLGLAFFRVHRLQGTMLSPAHWTWLHLLRGVKAGYDAVVAAGRSVDEILVRDMATELQSPREASMNGNPCFRLVQQSRSECFVVLRRALHQEWSAVTFTQWQDLYVAIEALSNIWEQICSGKMPNLLRTICVWPSNLPGGFVEMLTKGFIPGLIIYAHWLMLMVLVEHLWFIDDMGRAGIRNIVAACSRAEFGAGNLLYWPQQMLNTHSYIHELA